jgi:gluconokinase
MPVRLVIMGVSGCGKSTVGQMIADSHHLPFLDGDDFHPASNIQKMASGTPLNDDDRQPWLEELARQLKNHEDGCVIACSALKLRYRDTLRLADGVRFIHLSGDKATLSARLNNRSSTTDHFMSDALLDSQLDTLEDPSAEAGVITLDIQQSPDALLKDALAQLS